MFFLLFFRSMLYYGNKKGNDSIHKTTSAKDSLKTQIVKLEKLIKDGSYAIIPNKDFENIIDGKIENSIQRIIK